MSFNYSKQKDAGGGDSFWTSYSDLFLGMSVVFLLLYVTASLRTGTSGIQAQAENQKLSMQVKELQDQLKSYNAVKNNYLNQEATPEEAKQYEELMDKLSLLQEEAKDEREKLIRRMHEQQTKEKALNQYQQMVRNIINANAIAKTKIKTREVVIEDQDDTIDDQKENISALEKNVSEKQKQIADNERQIEETNKILDARLVQLKKAYAEKKLTQQAYQAQMAKIKADNDAKLTALNQQAEQYEQQLSQTRGQLGQAKQQLQQTQSQLVQTKGALQATQGKLAETEGELGATKGKVGQLAGELGAAKGKLGQLAGELGATQGKLQATQGELGKAKGQLGQLEGELGKTKGQLGQLSGELGKTKGQLGQLQGELGKAKGQLGQAQGEIGKLSADLAKAKADADARKEISKRIREGFAKAGVKADIDDRTGEVVINFGDVYFDSDSAFLKPKMKEVLQKAMPEYSKALFGDVKLRDKIASVEIIGFSSPTYQGKYVDPKSLDADNRKAINYNMDLSYRRAQAIFKHVFDDTKMNFSYQKDLLPLIKVTGRSFLAEKLPNARNPSSSSFCDTHDCRKAQRVIIKFSFDDKK